MKIQSIPKVRLGCAVQACERRVWWTSARDGGDCSFLPLVDAVMIVDGDRFLEKLKPNYVCPDLKRKVEEEKTLRSAIIERPASLDVAKLVERLEQEVTNGLGHRLLPSRSELQDSDSRKQFVNWSTARECMLRVLCGNQLLVRIAQRGISSGDIDNLQSSQCGYSQAASLTRHNSASQRP